MTLRECPERYLKCGCKSNLWQNLTLGGREEQVDFYEYDALVLRTICTGNENNPVGIEDIITMADWIYRLILTHWEVDTGLDHLIQAGYVIRQNDKFFVSDEVREFINTKLNRLGTLKQVEKLGKFLNVDHSKPKSLEQFGVEKVISIMQYNEAVENYRNRAKEYITKLESGRKRNKKSTQIL